MRRQQGISYWGVVALIFIAFIGVQFFVAVGGIYYDDYAMNKTIRERLRNVPSDTTPDMLMDSFIEQFNMNGLRDVKPSDRMTITMDNGDIQIVKKYEVRTQFIGNIDLVVHFNKTFDQKMIKADD